MPACFSGRWNTLFVQIIWHMSNIEHLRRHQICFWRKQKASKYAVFQNHVSHGCDEPFYSTGEPAFCWTESRWDVCEVSCDCTHWSGVSIQSKWRKKELDMINWYKLYISAALTGYQMVYVCFEIIFKEHIYTNDSISWFIDLTDFMIFSWLGLSNIASSWTFPNDDSFAIRKIDLSLLVGSEIIWNGPKTIFQISKIFTTNLNWLVRASFFLKHESWRVVSAVNKISIYHRTFLEYYYLHLDY